MDKENKNNGRIRRGSMWGKGEETTVFRWCKSFMVS